MKTYKKHILYIMLWLAWLPFFACQESYGLRDAHTPRQMASRQSTYDSDPATLLEMTLAPLSPEFGAAEPVLIKIVLKNTGKTIVRYDIPIPENDFEFTVRDASGELMPPTRYRRSRLGPRTSTHLGGLGPGDSEEYVVRINQIYDMTETGEYTIDARFVSPPTNMPTPWFSVLSNRVRVKVVLENPGGK
jgi:hypothetical protein